MEQAGAPCMATGCRLSGGAGGQTAPPAGLARAVVLIVIALMSASVARAAAHAPFNDAELRVRVGGHSTMRLAARDGVWEPVTQSVPSFNFVDYGFVTASEGSRERFKVSMQFQVDGGFRPRGHVFFDMEFQRQADGAYTGTYVETSAEGVGTGAVAAAIEPSQVYSAPGGAPVQREEFPRLLFRPKDIPALRERLKTPFGQAFLARAQGSKDTTVLGLLYRVTGEAKYAEEAMRIVGGMDDIDGNGNLSGDFGHTLVKVALTYDFCYDAWPAEFRAHILKLIRGRLPRRMHILLGSAPNYNQVSNYYGPSLGSTAIATLLFYGSKGPAPEPPTKPLCVLQPDCRIAPVTGYEPPEGVPVVPLESGKLPKDWIYTGGFVPAEGADLLAPFGGPAKARPSLGDTITDGKSTREFKALSHEPDKGFFVWRNAECIDITMAVGRLYHTESYFYTVLRNDKPGWYQFSIGADHKESFTYVNGVLIEEGQLMQLDKGLYTVLIKARVGEVQPWGRELMYVRFNLFQEGGKGKRTAEGINAAIRRGYEMADGFYRTQMAEWKARNEEDLTNLAFFLKGREQMYQHYRFGIGNGGFTAEVTHYGLIASRYPLLYAACYRNAFGRDVSTYPDTTHLLPRQMMQACFRGSTPVIMHMNVEAHFDASWCASYFPLVPEKWKPGLLWGWNRVKGVEFDRAASMDRATADKMMKGLDDLSLVLTFVNYPLGMDPVHPSKVMPLTWAADTLGCYVFRSGWEGKDEFVAQVFSKSIPIGAWNHPNCGAFRLWGLGHAWTSQPILRSGYRQEESVVQLPDDVTSESACGRIIHYATQADGSGALLIDMNDVYMAVKEEPPRKAPDTKVEETIETVLKDYKTGKEDFGITESLKDTTVPKAVQDFYREQDRNALRAKLPRLYNRYGERIPGVKRDSDVTGSRSLAFDYSGKSGAPCLMAMLDCVRGGRRKQWFWQLPAGDGWQARGKDNTFLVKYPDATLAGTFVSPSPVTVRFLPDQKMTFIGRAAGEAGQALTRNFDLIVAETAEKDVDFMVVVTVQRGEPPAVNVSGEGAGATATVGERTVRRDGTKIVVE